jgi:hypothetical protein
MRSLIIIIVRTFVLFVKRDQIDSWSRVTFSPQKTQGRDLTPVHPGSGIGLQDARPVT